jgi:hypothetical protein
MKMVELETFFVPVTCAAGGILFPVDGIRPVDGL